MNKTITGVKNLMINYNDEKNRKKLDFDIDGIVYKVNDLKLQKDWGITKCTKMGNSTQIFI